MKRIEMVMSNSTFELFRESATHLGIQDFEAMEIRRFGARHAEQQRMYMGTPFSVALPVRTKVQITVANSEVERMVRELAMTIQPDNISIVSIHQIDLTNLRVDETAESRALTPGIFSA